MTGGLVEIGADGRGFSYDNEGPRHAVLSAGLRDRQPAGHQWRVAGVHGRRRLPAQPSSGCPTAGPASRRRLARARLLERRRRDVDHVHAVRSAPGGPRRARVPCLLLRGRRLRAVGRRPPARPSSSGSTPPPPRVGRRGGLLDPQRCHPSVASRIDGRRRVGVDRESPTSPTRGSRRPMARSASTTASS